MGDVIETSRLTKRYGAARGIEDVSLTVRQGEIFGFLGPNGAGKTTTIRTLLDLLHPTSGSARLFGMDSHRERARVHARLGNLAGEFAVDPRWSGREVVAFVAGLRGMRTPGRATELAERFEADMERPVGELSRGNRQKIGLVQAAFHDPELLVLDEPTAGLDPLMQERFVHFVSEERARGHTVLLSSHDLDEVQRTCDRVGMIRDGRLVAVDDVQELTRRSFRHVAIEFAEPPDARELRGLPGVVDFSQHGRRVTFKTTGAIDAVVKAAARHTVTDLELAHPTLDEIFLTFYGGGGDEQR